MEGTLRAAENVVAVRKKGGLVSGGAGGDVKDVPYVGGDRDGCVLEGKTKGGRVGGDGDV